MTTPEEAKSEVEAAFVEYIEEASYNCSDTFLGIKQYNMVKLAFYAGVKFVADLNQEKIAQLIKEVD